MRSLPTEHAVQIARLSDRDKQAALGDEFRPVLCLLLVGLFQLEIIVLAKLGRSNDLAASVLVNRPRVRLVLGSCASTLGGQPASGPTLSWLGRKTCVTWATSQTKSSIVSIGAPTVEVAKPARGGAGC